MTELAVPPSLPHLAGCTVPAAEDGCMAALRSVIDFERHGYLRDHVFGADAFVPATMIMELLAEAALWFAGAALGRPDLGIVALRDFSVARALALPPGGALEARLLLREALAPHRDPILPRQRAQRARRRPAERDFHRRPRIPRRARALAAPACRADPAVPVPAFRVLPHLLPVPRPDLPDADRILCPLRGPSPPRRLL
jgi:hypothetical protein